MQLPKNSMGIGDRFARQGVAQLDTMLLAAEQGVAVTPVWNKSHREHTIVGSTPADVRAEADRAVRDRGWTGAYFVDADHISLKTVDAFLESSDFFTLDVADRIGVEADAASTAAFLTRHQSLVGRLEIPGLGQPLEISESLLAAAAGKFLAAVQEAGRIYRRIADAKGGESAVIEVSMDETDEAQTPAELLVILAAAADEKIPAQTIAPRFTGRFNKGVDYQGNLDRFREEFRQDLAVLAFAVARFGLPENLKLSIHSGSDKFSLYPLVAAALREFDAGVHLKTAGTTWLEELIGLAESGGDGLEIAKEVYRASYDRRVALCGPYAAVVDIDPAKLPRPEDVARWDGDTFAAILRHDPASGVYSPHVRQLLHVGYKVAAEMGDCYLAALDRHAATIADNVTENLYRRHIQPLFLGDQ